MPIRKSYKHGGKHKNNKTMKIKKQTGGAVGKSIGRIRPGMAEDVMAGSLLGAGSTALREEKLLKLRLALRKGDISEAEYTRMIEELGKQGKTKLRPDEGVMRDTSPATPEQYQAGGILGLKDKKHKVKIKGRKTKYFKRGPMKGQIKKEKIVDPETATMREHMGLLDKEKGEEFTVNVADQNVPKWRTKKKYDRKTGELRKRRQSWTGRKAGYHSDKRKQLEDKKSLFYKQEGGIVDPKENGFAKKTKKSIYPGKGKSILDVPMKDVPAGVKGRIKRRIDKKKKRVKKVYETPRSWLFGPEAAERQRKRKPSKRRLKAGGFLEPPTPYLFD